MKKSNFMRGLFSRKADGPWSTGETFISPLDRNVSAEGPDYQFNNNRQGALGNYGVPLFSPEALPGMASTYASSVLFDSSLFSFGPPLASMKTKLSDEYASVAEKTILGAFDATAGGYVAKIQGESANDELLNQDITFAGVKITSSDALKLITDINITAQAGLITTAGSVSVTDVGSWQLLSKRGGALTNLYVIFPLLAEVSGAQRTRLFTQRITGTGAERNGVQITVTGIPEDAAYSVTAFTVTRKVAAAKAYAASYGVF